MKKNGYSITEMLIVVMVLGVATLVFIGATSNAFKDDSKDIYEQTEHLILHQAEMYGKTLDVLKEEKNAVITVDDLVKNGYYVASDSSGNVTDPRNTKATLNGLKIKLVYEDDDKIKATIIQE